MGLGPILQDLEQFLRKVYRLCIEMLELFSKKKTTLQFIFQHFLLRIEKAPREAGLLRGTMLVRVV